MMRGEYAAQPIGARVGEVGRAAKEWATTETGATVLGVAGGIFAGEWLGSWLTEYFNIEDGWTKVIAKGVAKGALSFALFFIARRAAPGSMFRVFLQGAAAGPLVSIIGDVVGEVVAPGMLGLGGSGSSQDLNIQVSNPATPAVGGRGQVITI